MAIAGYPKDAIIDAPWIVAAMRRANTLPVGIDARYLLGNREEHRRQTEGEIIAEYLYRGRLEAREST